MAAYKVKRINPGDIPAHLHTDGITTPELFASALSQFDEEGWEVCGVVPWGLGSPSVVVFYREVESHG